MASKSGNDDPVATALDGLRQIVRALRVSAHGAERSLGLSGAQLFVLGELAAEPGASLSRLAERTATDPSSVSVVVARLVARGLVARGRDPADARRAVLTLLPKGLVMLRRAPEPVQARLLATLRELPRKRILELADVLAEISAALGIADDEAAQMFFEEAPKRRPRRV